MSEKLKGQNAESKICPWLSDIVRFINFQLKMDKFNNTRKLSPERFTVDASIFGHKLGRMLLLLNSVIQKWLVD